MADARRGHRPRHAGDQREGRRHGAGGECGKPQSQTPISCLEMGDVIKGGMQTRTVRYDTVLGPGQRLDLEVFCVEAHRWQGEKAFSAAKAKVPQSIQGQMRGGAGQSEVWKGVAGNNASLGAENDTGSLERALKSPDVERKLDAVRRRIVPEIPRGTVGFIFVHGGRGRGGRVLRQRGPGPGRVSPIARFLCGRLRDPGRARPDRPATTGSPSTTLNGSVGRAANG